MATGTVFINNRTQAVRLPAELRLPEGVKQVNVRKVGRDRVISPIGESWDSFFTAGHELAATEDFMAERGSQMQAPREVFE